MELTDLYVRYREEEVKFVGDRLIPLIKKEEIDTAARLLNIELKGNRFTTDNPMDFDYIMDFIIYELRVDGKNLVERYADEYTAENDREAAVINAMLNQHSSLFRVVNISKEKKILFYKDLLNDVRNTRLIDLIFSNTAEPGLLVYTRILPFPELNMTSGTSFVFPPEVEGKLIRVYSGSEFDGKTSMERFMYFIAASKVFGLAIGYEGVDSADCCDHDHQNHHDHHHDHEHHHHDHNH